MNAAHTCVLFSGLLLAAPLLAQNQITGGTCSASNLNGTYDLILSGRGISTAGNFAGSFQANGAATFDGKGAVTFTGTVNTNLAQGKQFTYSGTYTVPSNCLGTLTLNTGSSAAFTLVVWNSGRDFNITGSDATYVFAGSGGNILPPTCAAATLSGAYGFQTSGFTLAGTTQTGTADEAGVLQFDGVSGVTATYTVSSPGTTPATVTATGTYSVTSNCQATATLTDSTGKGNSLNFVVNGSHGESLDVLDSNSQFVRTGSIHSLFLNPSESIGNVASYAVGATPPGSVFVIFGQSLANNVAGAVTTTLPTQLGNATVTVNGEAVPLFYVSATQIDAQMPWDIPGGTVASVVVKNGTSTSNAAAVFVPATGTPGLSVYGNNRAVVVNQNGSVNSASDTAAVGDQVVAYFTGGGPVQSSGRLVTGTPAPLSLAPITGSSSVTLGTVDAVVKYIGLTPGSIGLYQVNFVVPQIARGTYPLTITIAGQASNRPLMTVSN